MIFGRIGRRLFVGWLGLTDENAGRMSSAIVVGLWGVFLIAAVSFGGGGQDFSSVADAVGEFLGRYWWIIILLAVSFIWKWLRKANG